MATGTGGSTTRSSSSSRAGLVAEIERQHGALVEEERLLEAGRKPADERFAVATPG